MKKLDKESKKNVRALKQAYGLTKKRAVIKRALEIALQNHIPDYEAPRAARFDK